MPPEALLSDTREPANGSRGDSGQCANRAQQGGRSLAQQGRDDRSAQEWYESSARPVRARRKLPWFVILIGIAVLIGGGFAAGRALGWDPTTASRDAVNSLLGDIPSQPPLPPETSTPDPSTSPSGTADPDSPSDPSGDEYLRRYRSLVEGSPGLIEGRDYSFIGKIDEAPVHWTCARDIPVVLSGSVPEGADAAFHEVVTALADVSRLQLEVVRESEHVDPTVGSIVVYYASIDVQPGSFSAPEGVAGRGGPRYYTSGSLAGMVNQGEVVVRDDIEGLEPTTRFGKDVLAHEIMHALGVGHSAEELPEVMAPVVDDVWPEIGAGDTLALRVIGCD